MHEVTQGAPEHVLLAHFAHHTDAERAQRRLRDSHTHLHAEIVESQVAPEHVPSAGRPTWGWRVTWTLGTLVTASLAAIVAVWIGYSGRSAIIPLLVVLAGVTALGLGALWRTVVQPRPRGAPDPDESVLRIAIRGDDEEVRAVLRAFGAHGIRDLTPPH